MFDFILYFLITEKNMPSLPSEHCLYGQMIEDMLIDTNDPLTILLNYEAEILSETEGSQPKTVAKLKVETKVHLVKVNTISKLKEEQNQ
jgi:hypothetical protein